MHSWFRRARPTPAAAPAPMPMLYFPGKKALHFAFAGDTLAAERNKDLAVLILARCHVVELASDGAGRHASAADAAAKLRAYLRVVYASEMRGASSHRLLRFAWRDAGPAGSGSSNKKASSSSSVAGQGQGHTSLAMEHAVALFALAAELARAAAEEDRRTPDGIRRACAALCDAAGALSVADVKVCVASEASGLRYMTGTCLPAFERLMLAQALECYFELAVAGGKPASLCSKIAWQVSQDYHHVYGWLAGLGYQHDHQQHPIDKSWVPHAQAKSIYFHAEACRLHARALLEKGLGFAGEAVAWLRYALSSVLDGAAGKAAIKRAAEPVRDAAAWLRREVEAELAAAEKDNCQVYCERVPAADALPELPGLSQPLVRASPEEKVLREADG